MKILYLANFDRNTNLGADEFHIADAIEKSGHEVDRMQERTAGVQRILGILKSRDCLLFSKGVIDGRPDGVAIQEVLKKSPKPCFTWVFDKFIGFGGKVRQKWVNNVVPHCTLAFVTDPDIVTAHPNARILRQGVGGEVMRFKYETSMPSFPKVAHVGQVYGSRAEWSKAISEKFGGDYKIISGVYGDRLSWALASVRVVVGPDWPAAPGYWSNRIYRILGHGGFFLAPEIEGMAEEGFEHGIHYVRYENHDDMLKMIGYWTSDEQRQSREFVRKSGQDLVLRKFRYRHRVDELLRQMAEVM